METASEATTPVELQDRTWVRMRARAKAARAEVRTEAKKAKRPARQIEIHTSGFTAIHIPAPIAIIGLAGIAIAVILAALDPAQVRFAMVDRQATQLASWEQASDARIASRAEALEAPLRELRREALMRGIAPEGDLAPSLCDGTPEAHAAGHVEEITRLSEALAVKHSGEAAPESLLPSRSPIDLAGDIPVVETKWIPNSVRVSSKEGERTDPFSGEEKEHKGVDIAAPTGTAVIAPAGGVVEFAGSVSPNVDHFRALLGNYVRIKHGTTGFVTIYAHLSKVDVKTGQTVHSGDRLGAVGTSGHSTAPHLHYQVMKDGLPVNPLAYIADVILVKDGKSVWYAKHEVKK